tara:strand:- start:179 stop:493 length:315 start_codon:yes stop_codon:yes gene_type:complete
MSKEKFTKGPWAVYRKADGYGKVDIDDLVVGMSTFNENPYKYQCIHKVVIEAGNDCEEGRSNAYLIKMAPEMYAKLQEISTSLQQSCIDEWEDIEKLLAEARGE